MDEKGLFDDSSYPLWLRRRWRVLKKLLVRADFREQIPALSEAYKANDNLPTKDVLKFLRAYEIPGNCVDCIYAVLDNPKLLDDDAALVVLIRPPVHYVSFAVGLRGPAENPAEDYRHWRRFRLKHLQETSKDLLEVEQKLWLEIEPFTTKNELMDYIKQNFDTELKPLLSSSESPFLPSALKQGRVSSVRATHELNERILAMYDSGMKPKQIADALPGDHEPSNITKRISMLRKQRGKRRE